jgi:hypothetical protein
MVTPIYGYREFFEGTVEPSKISVRGTIILVHGKWDMLYHITEYEQYCVALILLSNKILLKTLCMFLSGGHSPGNIKDSFNVCRTCFFIYFDLTNYQNCHHLYLRWLTLFRCASFFSWFASKEIIYRSLHFTCFSWWLLRTIKEHFLCLDDGVNNNQWKHRYHLKHTSHVNTDFRKISEAHVYKHATVTRLTLTFLTCMFRTLVMVLKNLRAW